MLSLRQPADVRTIVFTSAYFGLLYTIWNGFDGQLSTGVWTVLYLCTIFFSWVGAVAVHNTIHCPVFYSKTANKLLQITLSLVYGHPVCNYVPGHNLSHHQNTQTARDVMRTHKMRYKWHLLNGLLFGPVIGIGMLGNDVTYFSEQRKLGRPIFKQMKLEQVINFTCAAVLIILSPKKWVVCTLIPHLLAKFGIISLNILQHDGCDDQSPYNHSRNFVGRVLNFFAYNNGYHGIHHMHPGWHWSILPQKHAELVKPHLHPNLDQSSILGYTFRTFVYPGKRIDYLGKLLVLPPVQADKPWFYQTNETYSSEDKME